MFPKKKPATRSPKPTHVERRHGPDAAAPPQNPVEPDLASVERSTDPPDLTEWTALGASLLALPNGAHRVALAMHTARAAASGGIEIGADEARAMKQWLADTIDLAITRGGENAASAIWHVIAGDWQRDPSAIRPARCPAAARIEAGSGERELAAMLRTHARMYIRTVISGASGRDVALLREIVGADEQRLDELRPFGACANLIEDRAPWEDLEDARASLTARYPSADDVCSGVCAWASGMASAAYEHALTPVLRIGAIAWLAHVALAGVAQPVTGGCVVIQNETSLRGFLGRILGWSAASAVENALRSVHLSVAHSATLVLLGDPDLVPIAQGLHCRAVGAEPPFVVCDRRRADRLESVRAPRSYASGVAAIRAATGGSVCIRRRRIPRDFWSMAEMVKGHAPMQLIVCAESHETPHPFLLRPAQLQIPPLSARTSDLPSIVEEYAFDAIHELGAGETVLTRADRDWVIAHSASTLPEIEKGTRRLVALRQAGSIYRAAARLGISHVALSQWLGRRGYGRRGHRGGES